MAAFACVRWLTLTDTPDARPCTHTCEHAWAQTLTGTRAPASAPNIINCVHAVLRWPWCGSANVALPAAAAAVLSLYEYVDGDNGVAYCVLMDDVDADLDGDWDNGYLLFVVPRDRADVHRRLHFSAPHVVSDQYTVVQVRAVALWPCGW